MTDTVVLNLFGQAASTPQYAIHEEDRLEWLHALLTDTASLPDWLDYPLKHQPMLFIGCEIPDWLGRFLLRMSSESGCRWIATSRSSSLAAQPRANRRCRASSRRTAVSTLVQQLEMEPTEFVAELRTRWEKRMQSPRQATRAYGRSAGLASRLRDAPTIFISYMREDADAARRLCDAIREARRRRVAGRATD